MRSRPKDEEVLKDEQIKKPRRRLGNLDFNNDILRETLKPYSDKMFRRSSLRIFAYIEASYNQRPRHSILTDGHRR